MNLSGDWSSVESPDVGGSPLHREQGNSLPTSARVEMDGKGIQLWRTLVLSQLDPCTHFLAGAHFGSDSLQPHGL